MKMLDAPFDERILLPEFQKSPTVEELINERIILLGDAAPIVPILDEESLGVVGLERLAWLPLEEEAEAKSADVILVSQVTLSSEQNQLLDCSGLALVTFDESNATVASIAGYWWLNGNPEEVRWVPLDPHSLQSMDSISLMPAPLTGYKPVSFDEFDRLKERFSKSEHCFSLLTHKMKRDSFYHVDNGTGQEGDWCEVWYSPAERSSKKRPEMYPYAIESLLASS